MKGKRLNQGFLDAWSSIENSCFNGELRKDRIQDFTMNCSGCQHEFNQVFDHFHKRYQDEEKLNLFLDNEKNDWFQGLLNKDIATISGVEKTKFMTYVIERYKAYIFDQNDPEVLSPKYETELKYCVEFMERIYDHYQVQHQTIQTANENNGMSSVQLMNYNTLEKKQ